MRHVETPIGVKRLLDTCLASSCDLTTSPSVFPPTEIRFTPWNIHHSFSADRFCPDIGASF